VAGVLHTGMRWSEPDSVVAVCLFRGFRQQELALSSKIFMEGSVETMMSARQEVAKLRGLYVHACVRLCLCTGGTLRTCALGRGDRDCSGGRQRDWGRTNTRTPE
jgi:hypothetical protein